MPNESTEWLVMVYISADGLLANFAVESLKQLKRAAGKGVVVVARLGMDGITPAKRYVFKQIDDLGPLVDTKAEPAEPREGVKIPSAADLSDFINKAVETAAQAKHHALFLWGHGPELLSEEEPKSVADSESKKNSDRPRTYLTPSELRDALKATPFAKPDHKLDIIGLDACSMSMVELASELGDYVQFMVASQDDVPDMSFPYEAILPRLREPANANDSGKASTVIPEVYREAYLDYVASPRTGFRAITLSSVDLDKDKMGRVTAALTKLVRVLLELSKNQHARGEILKAREKAQGFVFGLFVDVVDLCDKLEASKIDDADLKYACTEMRDATKGAVIANETHRNPADRRVAADGKVKSICGLSIYFPYRVPDPTEALLELRAKGGSDRPLKGGSDRPLKERSLRIRELEQDFAELEEFAKTGWNGFIQQGWSSILANEIPTELDEVYSAQQCARNLGLSRDEGATSRARREAA